MTENYRECDDCGSMTCAEVAFIPLGDDKIYCEWCCPEGFGE